MVWLRNSINRHCNSYTTWQLLLLSWLVMMLLGYLHNALAVVPIEINVWEKNSDAIKSSTDGVNNQTKLLNQLFGSVFISAKKVIRDANGELVVDQNSTIYDYDNSQTNPDGSLTPLPTTLIRQDITQGVTRALKNLFATTNLQNFLINKLEVVDQATPPQPLNPFPFTEDLRPLWQLYSDTPSQIRQLLRLDLEYLLNTDDITKLNDSSILNKITDLWDNSNFADSNLRNTIKSYLSKNFGIRSNDQPQLQEVNETEAQNLPPTINASALLQNDNYSDAEASKVKLFLQQLLEATPILRIIKIPAKPATETTASLPENGFQFQLLEGNYPADIGENNKKGITDQQEYNDMLNYFHTPNGDQLNRPDSEDLRIYPIYQAYRKKLYGKLALRSIYFSTILQSFQNRKQHPFAVTTNEKDQNGNNIVVTRKYSLRQKENEMAMLGLTKKYYENFANKTAGEIQLETIYTLNKIVYFLNKMYQEQERTNILIAISGMQLQQADIADNTSYVTPIVNAIANRCWSSKADGRSNKKICKNLKISREVSDVLGQLR